MFCHACNRSLYIISCRLSNLNLKSCAYIALWNRSKIGKRIVCISGNRMILKLCKRGLRLSLEVACTYVMRKLCYDENYIKPQEATPLKYRNHHHLKIKHCLIQVDCYENQWTLYPYTGSGRNNNNNVSVTIRPTIWNLSLIYISLHKPGQ